MDGSLTPLQFPVAAPPPPGETLAIAPGVRWLRMPLPFALDHINLWLLEDGDGWMIVDAGYALPETKGLWERIFVRAARRTAGDAGHRDPLPPGPCRLGRLADRALAGPAVDHRKGVAVGTSDEPRRRGFRVGCGAISPIAPGSTDTASEAFGEREQSYRRGVPDVPASYRRLADGMVIEIGGRKWQVVVGEGHAPELACLYCAETGVLIAGDQVLPKISPNISVQAHEPEGDPLARYLSSLRKLRDAVPPETLVLPSHNLPFFGLHARLESLAAHHERALRRGDRRMRVVPKTAVELMPVLFRRPLDRHQMGFALGEALAHLHYLMYQGALERCSTRTASIALFGRRGKKLRLASGRSNNQEPGEVAMIRLGNRCLLAAAALCLPASCLRDPRRSAEPITIGFGMALTGGLAAAGKSALLAMQIWQDDVNAKGGLLGRPVKLIYYDDQSNPATVPGHLHKAARRRQGRPHRVGLRHQPDRAGDAGGDRARPAVPRPVRARGQQRVPLPKYFSMLPTGPDPKHAFSEPFFKVAMAANPKPKTIALARRRRRVPEERLRRRPRPRQDLRAQDGLRQDLPAGDARLHADRPCHPGDQPRYGLCRLLSAGLGRHAARRDRKRAQDPVFRRRHGRVCSSPR